MTIALTPETTRLVEQHFATAVYRSADELVRAAITAFTRQDENIASSEAETSTPTYLTSVAEIRPTIGS